MNCLFNTEVQLVCDYSQLNVVMSVFHRLLPPMVITAVITCPVKTGFYHGKNLVLSI